MLYHAPRRADQPLPCTTNTASYAHFPPIPYHDPSIKYAPARRPHESWQPNIRPDHARYPNSLRLPLCCLLPRQTNFSTGLWDDRRLSTFLRCIALMGLKLCSFWKRNLGSAGIAMRYTLHGSQQHFIPPNPCFFRLQRYGALSLAGVTLPPSPIPYHRDGMARVADVL
jgi:hypothetical protein